MSCSDCNKTKKILSCTTVLTIGLSAAYPTTAVYVYIKSHTTGRVYFYSATTSGAGLITATITAQQFAEGHDYELWVTLATATNPEEKIDFVIDATTVNCLSVKFQKVYTSADVIQSGVQTLALE